HLHQQGIQGLLTFVIAPAQTMSPAPSDGVDFIDENQTRSVLTSLFEHIANTTRAHADKHLHKIRSTDAEEGGVRFSRDRFREQGLAGSRRAHHENSLRDASAQFLKLLGVFQKLDQFRNLLLGLFDTGNVLESRAILFLVQHASLALAKAQRAFSSHLDLSD